MDFSNTRLYSIEQAADLLLSNKKTKSSPDKNGEHISFDDILKQTRELDENSVRFSKHANQRLSSRNISLSDEQLGRLNEGISKARDKSINESLVMLDNLAFIVNIKNNTVVTALEQNDDNNVFTNIDGAVIV